jgi:hypothetical protein
LARAQSEPILRTGALEAFLLVLRFVRTAMSGAAMWAIVVTRGRPHILPFFVAPVALVKVAEEVLGFHGKLSFLNARNFGPSDRAHPGRVGQATPRRRAWSAPPVEAPSGCPFRGLGKG